jgi:hypothetical protein
MSLTFGESAAYDAGYRAGHAAAAAAATYGEGLREGEANARLALEALARRCGELQAERDAVVSRAKGTLGRWIGEMQTCDALLALGDTYLGQYLRRHVERWAKELQDWR